MTEYYGIPLRAWGAILFLLAIWLEARIERRRYEGWLIAEIFDED